MMKHLLKWGTVLAIVLGLLGLAYGFFLYRQIRDDASRDDTHAADAIVVLGAAQYNGRPSPVFKSRLDHA